MDAMKTKQVEIDGTIYTIKKISCDQYIGIYLRHMDKSGKIIKAECIPELFQKCVVEAEITMESFNDNMNAGFKLVKEIQFFNEQRTIKELVGGLPTPLAESVLKFIKALAPYIKIIQGGN